VSNEPPIVELSLQELMAAPIVRLIMKSDRIGEREVHELLGRSLRLNEPDSGRTVGRDATHPGRGPLRQGVGVMLVNSRGLVFAGKRNDVAGGAWQMPQGGVEPNETELDAALRELREETGISAVEILGESAAPLSYELPPGLLDRLPALAWRGQSQRWFLMRFLGKDADIDVATGEPEFCDWKWMTVRALLDEIVPFKQEVYKQVVAELTPFLADICGPSHG
jgi:putative (di)nucleoside polyphosphate hydrolase